MAGDAGCSLNSSQPPWSSPKPSIPPRLTLWTCVFSSVNERTGYSGFPRCPPFLPPESCMPHSSRGRKQITKKKRKVGRVWALKWTLKRKISANLCCTSTRGCVLSISHASFLASLKCPEDRWNTHSMIRNPLPPSLKMKPPFTSPTTFLSARWTRVQNAQVLWASVCGTSTSDPSQGHPH